MDKTWIDKQGQGAVSEVKKTREGWVWARRHNLSSGRLTFDQRPGDRGMMLTHGFLLMPAERHAGCPCVTASMDDIYFEHTIR